MVLAVLCLLLECSLILSANIRSATHHSKDRVGRLRGRALVILFGESRGGQIAWESVNDYVLDYYHADLALIGPHDTNTTDSEYLHQRAKYIWPVENNQRDWGDFFDKIGGSREWRQLCEYPGHYLGGVRDCGYGSAGIVLAYRYLTKMKIMALKLTRIYEWFIYSRPDYVYLCAPPPLHTLAKLSLHIPAGEGWGGYTDRHIIVSSKLVVGVLNITEDLILRWRDHYEYCKLSTDKCSDRNVEIVLKTYLEYMNYSVSLFDHTAFTVRRVNDPSSWAKGYEVTGITDKYGLLVKYTFEMDDAVRNCDPLRVLERRAISIINPKL